MRQAMITGDEAHLPARDKGPERRFIRDSVDARWNVGEFMLPVMLVVLALSFVRQSWALLIVFIAVYGVLLVAVVDAVLMWRRVGRVDASETMLALGRIVLAAAIASGLAVLVWWGVDAVAGRSAIGQIVSVGAGLGVGIVAYVGACRVLGVRELGSLLELRRRA